MDEEAKKLLLMFITDGYRSQTGKISKKTAIAMMRYVSSDSDLQMMINNSDWAGIRKYAIGSAL